MNYYGIIAQQLQQYFIHCGYGSMEVIARESPDAKIDFLAHDDTHLVLFPINVRSNENLNRQINRLRKQYDNIRVLAGYDGRTEYQIRPALLDLNEDIWGDGIIFLDQLEDTPSEKPILDIDNLRT